MKVIQVQQEAAKWGGKGGACSHTVPRNKNLTTH